MTFQEIMETVGKTVDAAGVLAIVVGVIAASVIAFAAVVRKKNQGNVYHNYRRMLGRSILLGLELLVAADIIRTVAVTPTFRSVGVLAVIVLIRTFLSFSLELEITGRWPWQKERDDVVPQIERPTHGGAEQSHSDRDADRATPSA